MQHYPFMCIHDVCIVHFDVFIHVSMRMYLYMPILCVFKPVYCRCCRDMQIDFKRLPVWKAVKKGNMLIIQAFHESTCSDTNSRTTFQLSYLTVIYAHLVVFAI